MRNKLDEKAMDYYNYLKLEGSNMNEECAICGAINTLAELINIKTLNDNKNITYITRMLHCTECKTYSASSMHMHLNKLEMLMALEKQKSPV